MSTGSFTVKLYLSAACGFLRADIWTEVVDGTGQSLVRLEQAIELLAGLGVADSLQPNNSEIYVLLNMVTTLRIRLNPMVNGQKYGPIAALYLEKAQQLDPNNPRADMQEGLALFFTPPQWGGDKAKAVVKLESAQQKFDSFQPASSIHPNWGKEANQKFLEMAKKG